MRARPLAGGLVLALTMTMAGCGGTSTPEATNWSPAPRTVDRLSTIAQSDAAGFRLHTTSGEKTFLPGINLGSTVPLHQPGEVGTIPATDYRRWLTGMGKLGIRVVRIYTLLPPAFYNELARHNRAHPTAPLYLVQGVYLPNESYNQPGKTLYDKDIDQPFRQEIRDVSAAVHGDLIRPPAPGRAGGSYHTDVSAWLLSWIIGIEWDPSGVVQTDRLARGTAYVPGRYFAATAAATPTERWIATHMELTAELEAKRGTSMPIAFANWPTTDPLRHPEEPLRNEDLVGVDANHILPTAAWPGGTFASFHAYPYYPDFQRYEPALALTKWHGKVDRYAGYLMSLKKHFAAHMPLMISEFGVPSSLGSAHIGTNGRGQGAHSEQQAMAIDADLMRMMAAHDMAGGFIFAWSDEWFKKTWNTMEHQEPERRQLWHDPLTNEQWFGLVGTDPEPVPDAAAELTPKTGPYKYLYTWADAAWVHLDVTLRDALPDRLVVEADVLPGPDRADYRIVVDRTAGEHGTARLFVRKDLDPVRLDTQERPYRPDQAAPWHLFRLLLNRSFRAAGVFRPMEYQDIGDLIEGSWKPTSKGFDSMATWNVDEPRKTVRLRIPWSMLGMADPSSRTALGEGIPAELVKIDRIRFGYQADGAAARLDFSWPAWNFTGHRERLKAGIGDLEKAYRDLAR